VLFGAIGDPKYDNDQKQSASRARIVKIEKKLGLCKYQTYKTISTLLDPLWKEIIEGDFIIFRELTEGSYFGEKN
jgi:isocitrate/isopropylmalate dehydrogenase